MARFQIRRYSEIARAMIARLLSRSVVSDIGDASVAKHVLVNTARSLDRAYYDMSVIRDEYDLAKCRGDALDARALEIEGIEDDDATRLGAEKAYGGAVVFWRLVAAGTVVIPAGTIVKTSSGRAFATVAQVQIEATSPAQIAGHAVGLDSPPVSIVALEAGAAGNVAIGAIVAFGSKPAGVDDLQNLAPTLFGRDREGDEDFYARLQSAIRRLGKVTRQAIIAAALKVRLDTGQRVISARKIDDFDELGRTAVYIDDGAGTAESTTEITGETVTTGLLGPPTHSAVGGEEFLRLDEWPVKTEAGVTITSSTRGALTAGATYFLSPTDGWIKFDPALVATEVITADYTAFTGLIAEVQKVLDGLESDPATYPGYDAAGSQVRVLAPTVLWQRFEATLVIKEGFDRAAVIAEATDLVARYYNQLPEGEDVIRTALIALIGPRTTSGTGLLGVADLTMPWPLENQPVDDDEVARILSTAIAIT